MSVLPSAHTEQLGSTEQFLIKFYILLLLETVLREFKFYSNLTGITATYMKTCVHL